MTGYKITILDPAITEIAESSYFYNTKLAGLGLEFEEEIFQLIDLIKKNPLLFPVKFAQVHEAVVKRFPFVINYEVFGKEIIVSSVFHSKQHPKKKIKNSYH
ncbi:MAG: hypothetical protein IT236_06750 [Bacteroidia bacterium]|nr:hypothetical protein [Bacteroidia bacterium]